jgi:hypothetical protein
LSLEIAARTGMGIVVARNRPTLLWSSVPLQKLQSPSSERRNTREDRWSFPICWCRQAMTLCAGSFDREMVARTKHLMPPAAQRIEIRGSSTGGVTSDIAKTVRGGLHVYVKNLGTVAVFRKGLQAQWNRPLYCHRHQTHSTQRTVPSDHPAHHWRSYLTQAM